MTRFHPRSTAPSRPRRLFDMGGLAAAACAFAPLTAFCQTPAVPGTGASAPAYLVASSAPAPAWSSSLAEPAADPLPDSPLPQFASEPKPKRGSDPAEHIARKDTMTIPSNWHAQRLNGPQKFKAGLEDSYGTETIAAWFLAAGWEQLTNGSPNYGTDKGAFGARLGAAAIRATSQNIFSEAILAPVLHEDARYYVEGPKYNPVHRTLYAVTRPLITRNDDGKATINGSLLIGYAGAAALTPAYYPSINRNFRDVASAYGGGIGGAALGYFVSEFSEDVFRALHLKRAP